MSRSFTIDAVYYRGKKLRFSGGRYISENAASAAKKAYSQLYRNYKQKCKAHNVYIIHMRETTQGSEHKVRKYKVQRIPEKQGVVRDGTIIMFNYKTVVKAVE
jgi:hypothetical protein